MGCISLRHGHVLDLVYCTFADGSDGSDVVILVHEFLEYAFAAICWRW
jgi:hypothetical protein